MSRQYIIETLNAALLAALAPFDNIDAFNENGPQPDFANQSRPWLAYDVVIDQRPQVSLGIGASAVNRYYGGVHVGAFQKVGTGTFEITAVLDALDRAMSSRSIGGIVMGGPRSFRPPPHGDWNPSGVQYLFTYDEVN